MLGRVKHILEMIRFSHTLFALPFAMLSAMMAWFLGSRSDWRWQELVGILLCMATARSASMAFNRIVDRRLDAQNPRTQNRHIPSGVLSLQSVSVFTVVCSVAFVASTLLFLPNRLPLYLSVPVLAFLLAYSFTKRFTAWSHVWLGASLMLAPVSSWIAIRGKIILENPADLVPALVLGGGVLLWVTGFDIIYACQDVEFDRKKGLHSVPARFGVRGALRLAAVCHLGTVALFFLLCLPSIYPHLSWIYGCGILAVAILLAYEHLLVRPDDLKRVNVAFFNINAILSIGLFFLGTLDMLTLAARGG